MGIFRGFRALFCLPQALGVRNWEFTRMVVPLMMMDKMRGIYLDGKTRKFLPNCSIQMTMVPGAVGLEDLNPGNTL